MRSIFVMRKGGKQLTCEPIKVERVAEEIVEWRFERSGVMRVDRVGL